MHVVFERPSLYSHDDEAHNVKPDRQVAKPAQTLQTANIAHDHANDHSDDHTCDEADAVVRKLSNHLRIAHDDDGHREELLKGLGNVDGMTRLWTVDAEEGITKAQHGEPGGIEAQEAAPDHPAADTGEDTEDDIECDSRSIANAGEYESIAAKHRSVSLAITVTVSLVLKE